MSHTDTAPQTALQTTSPAHATPTQEPTMTPTRRLASIAALLTLVLTIALPLGQAAYTLLTAPTPHPAQTSPSTSATPDSPTPDSPRTSRADKAAAAHDGCRQTSSSDTLLARPSCRSGMPVTRDRGTLQAPDTAHPGAHPVTPNEVPPSWSDHWGAAAHSPHHHSHA